MSISRRDFLLRSAGFVTVSAMVPRWAVAGTQNFEESLGSAYPGRTLVVLELMGGNDGLNTVIPYTDNAYHDARPDLAYAPTDVLPLDGQLGLNPALKGLAKTWTDNKLAVVRGVGYPKPDRSHVRGVRGLPREQHHRCDIRAHRQGRRPDYGCSRAAGRRPGYLVKWRESAGS